MIVFGGKNAENDMLFNDVYLLSIPSFNWYIPRLQVINSDQAPSRRLGHAAAVNGDFMFIFGGHLISAASKDVQEVSNELFVLDL